MNKVFLLGNLGKDPEVRHTGSGTAVCKFPLATTKKYTKDGERQEQTAWHNVVVWGNQGENCGKYLTKGRQALVEGEIRTRSYDDKDGNKRYITEIHANNVTFIGGGNGGGASGAEDHAEGTAGDEDIPF